MKKQWLIILGVIIVWALWLMGKYNGLVALDEGAKTAWSQVENQYQRRTDLIPNLVNTVKWFAAQEQAVFIGVTEARAKATQMQVDINDPASLEKFQAAQGQVTSALSRLLATVENYPDLKSNQNFLELQAQLEGTENRISTERMRFNEVIQAYNISVRSFPTSLIAGLFGFHQKTQFAAQAWAEKVPAVDFTK